MLTATVSKYFVAPQPHLAAILDNRLSRMSPIIKHVFRHVQMTQGAMGSNSLVKPTAVPCTMIRLLKVTLQTLITLLATTTGHAEVADHLSLSQELEHLFFSFTSRRSKRI